MIAGFACMTDLPDGGRGHDPTGRATDRHDQSGAPSWRADVRKLLQLTGPWCCAVKPAEDTARWRICVFVVGRPGRCSPPALSVPECLQQWFGARRFALGICNVAQLGGSQWRGLMDLHERDWTAWLDPCYAVAVGPTHTRPCRSLTGLCRRPRMGRLSSHSRASAGGARRPDARDVVNKGSPEAHARR